MPFGKIGKSIGGIFKGASKAIGGIAKAPFDFITPEVSKGLTGLSGVVGGLGAAGNILGDLMTSPEESGHDQGLAQKAFMDAAYPGTNAWERLGTGQAGGSGEVIREGQERQERIAERQMSMQEEIATKQAMATLAPEVMKQAPHKMEEMISRIDRGGSAVGRDLGPSIQERQLALDENIRTVQNEIASRGVDVQAMQAWTSRGMLELEQGKFDFDAQVRRAETVMKDQELAVKVTQALKETYDSLGSNPWRKFRSLVDKLDSDVGLNDFMKRWLSSVQSIRDRPSVPMPKRRYGGMTSAPSSAR